MTQNEQRITRIIELKAAKVERGAGMCDNQFIRTAAAEKLYPVTCRLGHGLMTGHDLCRGNPCDTLVPCVMNEESVCSGQQRTGNAPKLAWAFAATANRGPVPAGCGVPPDLHPTPVDQDDPPVGQLGGESDIMKLIRWIPVNGTDSDCGVRSERPHGIRACVVDNHNTRAVPFLSLGDVRLCPQTAAEQQHGDRNVCDCPAGPLSHGVKDHKRSGVHGR